MYTYNCKIKDQSDKMIYSNNFFFGMSNSISNLKEKETVWDGGWGKANINLRIDNNFCYFLKYLCGPEKGCFSCVVLKRAVFCKRCYCCLMPVIFAWNSGCWSFSAKYLSDLCRDLSGKTCFNFGCWFPDLSVSQTSIFFRILYYFCHSRQLP